MTDTATSRVEEEKDLKVRIPVRHHLRLHSIKVLTGKQISEAITEALDAYFAEREVELLKVPSTMTTTAEETRLRTS